MPTEKIGITAPPCLINVTPPRRQAWAGKLDGQDSGVSEPGRKLSDSGAKARLYHEVKEAHLAKIVKVDLKSDLFSYAVDEDASSARMTGFFTGTR